ncbi:ATP-dependent nuclease [Microbispora bryophytorum]|uniref:ATP-dependent nuclease n=1 Tax=Microbispora bryophytorum TaxID=1460882 RepID=UPI0034071833
MKYQEFRFKNFKGIQELSLPLNEGVTTLIGLNESGKTTVLEAIFCFRYGAEPLEAINPGMAPLRQNPEAWIPVSQRANFNDVISITAVVSLDWRDRYAVQKFAMDKYGLNLDKIPSRLEIREEYKFENSRYVSERYRRLLNLEVVGKKGRERKPRRYGSATAEWQGIVAYIKTQLPRIWYFPDFLFELPDRFVLSKTKTKAANLKYPFSAELQPSPTIDRTENERNRFYRAIFQNILDRLYEGATLKTHIVERMQSQDIADRRSLSALLLDMSRFVTDTVIGGWSRIFGRTSAAQEVQIDANFDVDGTPCLTLRIKTQDGYYDLSERSLGFRWFFMFLLMTSFPKRSSSEPKPLILLDEPASNLHSSAQAELLKSFEKLTEDCNLAYTTHSHHLINVRWLDSAYVVKNSAVDSSDLSDYLSASVGDTSITATRYRQFVNDNPTQTSYIQPVLDLLNYQPSTLEPVPDVVLVEGKSDFLVLRYMLEIMGVNSDLKIVPGGGAGSLDPLIRLHIGWGKSFLILLDGDAEGRKQRERYEREFGTLISGRCALLPDLCADEKVLELENLFSKDDRVKIVTQVFPDVDARRAVAKKKVQQALLELYARRDPVMLESTTIDRFTKLFEELEQHLAGS